MTRDPLDDLGPLDPGLTELFSHLTSDPSADELSGEYAALTMFRAARESAPTRAVPARAARESVPARAARGAAPSSAAARRRRGFSPARLGGRLVAAATVVALGGGFAAAGYAQVLPAPLQQVAHQILGFAGVPNSSGRARPTMPVAGHSTRGGIGPGGSHSPQPGSSGSPDARSSSPSPQQGTPSHGGSVAIAAARRQIAAGSGVQITAWFTRKGQAVIGVSLSLAEQAAGRSSWHVVGHAATGPAGQADFTVHNLTTNASFHVTGPRNAVSGELHVVVIPAMTVTKARGAHGKSEMLIVSIPLAQRGDAVQLEYQVAGQWQPVRTHRLHRGGQTEFSVVARKISVTYRVVLTATGEHGQSVSRQVTVAARPKKKGGPGRH